MPNYRNPTAKTLTFKIQGQAFSVAPKDVIFVDDRFSYAIEAYRLPLICDEDMSEDERLRYDPIVAQLIEDADNETLAHADNPPDVILDHEGNPIPEDARQAIIDYARKEAPAIKAKRAKAKSTTKAKQK